MTNKPSLSNEQRLASPCVKICVRERETGICLGCGRTSDEINNWLTLPKADRAALLPQLDERLEELTRQRKSKRTGRRDRQRLRADKGLDNDAQ